MFEGEEKEESSTDTAEKGNALRTIAVKALGALLLVGIGAGLIYFGVKTKPEWFGIKNEALDQAKQKKELEKLINEVNEIIQLPEGETPTLAIVSDLEKVKDQQFFKNAQNGDKVLIYSNAKKAYLYRQSEKRIIEVGVVNLNQQKEEVKKEDNEAEVTIIPVTPTAMATPRPRSTATPTPSPSPEVSQ